jgi:hypothetical protein
MVVAGGRGEAERIRRQLDAESSAAGRNASARRTPAPGGELVATPLGCFRQVLIRCGKDRCRCSSSDYRHGPYWYRYYWRRGRVVCRYVGKTLPTAVQLEFELIPNELPAPDRG